VTQEWADLIGADGYARHAPDAIRIARELAGVTAPA
jgi:methanogenic corrinoid protein MtbC1